MKKRFLSTLLALVMLLSLLPTTAFAKGGGHNTHTDAEGNTITFDKPWGNGEGEATSLPTTAGNYYLIKDVTISGKPEISAAVNLCLNDHVITCTGFRAGIDVKGGSFGLYDCPQTERYFTVNKDGRWNTTNDKAKAQKTVVGGAIVYTYNGDVSSNLDAHVGVNVTSGTFNMYGGTICGFIKNGVRVAGGTFNMHGGSICGNAGTMNGPGVWVNTNCSFTMKGGSICDNKNNGTPCGGGVWTRGSFTMNGGTISGNKADNNKTNALAQGNGGGVFVDDNGNFVMNDGVITGNAARTAGGGVYIREGSFTMHGGSITNNTVLENGMTYPEGGGGVFIEDDSDNYFKMDGGIITGNSSAAADKGGGVESRKMEHTIIGGTAVIAGNFSNGVACDLVNYTAADKYALLGTGTGGGQNGVKVPADGMSVGLYYNSSKGPAQFSGGNSDYLKYFFANQADKYVLLKDTDKITLETLPSGKKVTVVFGTGGVVYADKQYAGADDTVELTIVPNTGYELDTLVWNDGSDHEIVNSDGYRFAMPNPAKDVTVTATFDTTNPAIKVAPVKDASNPVYGTAVDDTLFTVKKKHIDSALVLQWQHIDPSSGDETWNTTSPQSTLSVDTAGKVTTDNTTPAGDYVFRITNGKEDGANDFVSSGPITLTIEKAEYTGMTKTASGKLKATSGETVDITLPDIPDSASYGKPTKGSAGDKYTLSDSVSNKTVTVTSTGIAQGTGAMTFTVPVVSSDTNYKDYTITVTITPTFKKNVTISGVSMAYPNSQTNFIYGDTVGYTGTLAAVETGTTTAATITSWEYTYYLNDGTTKTTTENSGALSEGAAPVNAGDYKLVISVPEANENYTGSLAVDFTIEKKTVDLIWSTIGTGDDTYKATYNGEDQANKIKAEYEDNSKTKHTVVVSVNKKEASKQGALKVVMPKFKDAGDYTATAMRFDDVNDLGSANYALPTEGLTQDYTMKPKALTATVCATKVYDGTTAATADQVTATVTTGIDGETLTISDVTGTFNSANVAECQTVTPDGTNMTVTGGEGTSTENYIVSLPESGSGFITAFALGNATVTVDSDGYDYTSPEVKPTPAVTFDTEGKLAIPVDDYTLSYEHNTAVAASTLQTGAPTVTVTPKQGNTNVTGSKSVKFTITKAQTPPDGTPKSFDVNAVTSNTLSLSDIGITLTGAKITAVTAVTDKTGKVLSTAPSIIDSGAGISWTTKEFPSGTENDQYKLTISSNNYKDFDVTVSFTGKIVVTFDESAKPVNGGNKITFSDSGTSYDVTAPTVSVGGNALDPQPQMTYTYYQNTGTDGSPVWTLLNPNEKPTNAGDYKVEISVNDNKYTGSKEYTFSIAKADVEAPALADGVNINYANEKIAPKTGYEISTTSGDVFDTGKLTGETVIDFTKTYYVRKTGDSNHDTSAETTYTPERPAAPAETAFTKTAESVENKKDGSLSGITEAMEYKKDGGDWTSGPKTLTGLSDETVKVRYKATDTAFKSEEYSYTFTPSTAKLTVTMNGAGTQVAYNAKLTKPSPDPEKSGYTFGGWYKDEELTQAWNFGTDTVTGNMTLYPKWIENSVPSAVIKGKVTENVTTNVPGATVELCLGAIKVATTVTDSSGNYSFDHVENGIYNIVVTKVESVNKTKIKTEMVAVDTEGDYSVDVDLPAGDVSSVVKVQPSVVEGKVDATGTVVGALDEIAAAKAETGKSVIVKLVVEPKDEAFADHAADIKAKAGSGNTVEFLDMSLWKQVNDGIPANIGDDNTTLLTIRIPMNTTGLSNIIVYRYHEIVAGDNNVDVLKTTPAANGEKIEIAADFVTIYAMKFSEYAIAYKEQSEYHGGGSGSGSYAVTVNDAKNGTVSTDKKSASAGSTVTITVAPDKGYTLETLTVLDKNGKEVEVKNLGNNKFSFKMPSGNVSISATFMEDNTMLNFFVDVKATDYFYDAVLWAAENDITKGTDAVHFSPNLGVTRAQVVTFLWRASGCPEPTGNASKFTDVVIGSYYEKAVAWAIEQGITKGTSDTTFSPDKVCTRGQIVTFLARFAGVKDEDKGYTHGFTDVKATDYYNNAVAWAKDNGVTEGTSKTTFSPNTDCTRAQVVTFLYRWMVK